MHLPDIINQLNQTYSGDPWYGPTITTCLDRLTPDVLKKSQGGHSVGQILEHMITWRKQVIHKLQGDPENVQVNSSSDWNPKTETDLTQLINGFQETQSKLIHLLSQQTDDLLDKQVPGKEYTFGYLLPGIIQHDLYHLGQVFLLIR